MTPQDTYWAAFLGCEPEHLVSPDIVLVPHFVESNYEGYYLFSRGNGCVITIFSKTPASLYKRIEAVVGGQTPRSIAEPAFWEEHFADRQRLMGPAMVGYTDAQSFTPAESRETRRVTPASSRADAEALRRLFGACTVQEWEHSGILFEHDPIFGAFNGERLVAAASREMWSSEIAHIGVAVDPDHRGRGYGSSVVSALTADCLAKGLVPQYRTLLSNHKSVQLAHRLGYREYARTLSITMFDSD